MKFFNLCIETLIYSLYLSLTFPLITDSYSYFGAALPQLSFLFLHSCNFWSSLGFFPITFYLLLCLAVSKYVKKFATVPGQLLLRLPILFSLFGSLLFLPLPLINNIQ